MSHNNALELLRQFSAKTLLSALRSYHVGTDRGELRDLLCEVWGPRPAVVTVCEKCRSAPSRTDGVYCATCHGSGGHPADDLASLALKPE